MSAAAPSADCFSNADFQCLQDQLVQLRTTNYNLNDANRRHTSDLELAKSKISQLQRQLEEQERDFQTTANTLRGEVESLTCERDEQLRPQIECLTQELTAKQDEFDDALNKITALHELCSEHEKNLETLRLENEELKLQLATVKESNAKLILEQTEKLNQLYAEQKRELDEQRSIYESQIEDLQKKFEKSNQQVEQLRAETSKFDAIIAEQIEERKINEKKGLRMVKELKRQLLAEQNRAETLQKRLQEVLSSDSHLILSTTPTTSNNRDAATERSLSTSSVNANGSGTNGGGGGGGADSSSVGSWSFMPHNQTAQSTNTNLNESLSLCSISDSEDRETVQISSENLSEALSTSMCDGATNQSAVDLSANSGSSADLSPSRSLARSDTQAGDSTNEVFVSSYTINAAQTNTSVTAEQQVTSSTTTGSLPLQQQTMLLEDHAALVDRVTRLQQENWKLEEKLNYLESSNVSLSQDLINKSEIIRHYCMESGRIQGGCASYSSHYPPSATDLRFDRLSTPITSVSISSSVGRQSQSYDLSSHSISGSLLNDKMKGVKKVVDFIKERGGSSDLEHMRDSTRKMQLMLEETLTKNIHLQKNLDILSDELAKLKAKQVTG